MIFILFFMLILWSGTCEAADKYYVLDEKSLGSWLLSEDTFVSMDILERYFPGSDIIYRVGHGDSPDFHYYEVRSDSGESLFSAYSYNTWEAGPLEPQPDAEVLLHLLEIQSPRIADSNGIKVGDRIADIIDARGRDLEFGPGHHHIYIGAGNIFYNLITEPFQKNDFPISQGNIKLEEVIEENWEIDSISWPDPKWD